MNSNAEPSLALRLIAKATMHGIILVLLSFSFIMGSGYRGYVAGQEVAFWSTVAMTCLTFIPAASVVAFLQSKVAPAIPRVLILAAGIGLGVVAFALTALMTGVWFWPGANYPLLATGAIYGGFASLTWLK